MDFAQLHPEGIAGGDLTYGRLLVLLKKGVKDKNMIFMALAHNL